MAAMAARALAAQQTNFDRFQCMFTWIKEIPDAIDSKLLVTNLEDKLLTSDCDWQSIIYHLVLFYEGYRLKNSAAREHLCECEIILSNSEFIATSPLIKRNMVALKHVVHSSWIHFVAETHSYDVLEDYLQGVVLYRNMTKEQKAGVLGIHAACLMEYGLKGNRRALEHVKLAIKNNEYEGHWHFLQSQALRYERLSGCEEDLNSDDRMPTSIEIKSAELALFYDEHTPSHYIALAGSLHDSVKKKKGPCEVRDKATQLYNTALENWPSSPYVNLMAASGLLSYAYPVRNTRLADKCLGKVLLLVPQSSHVNLVAGAYYKWPGSNTIAAERHLNVAKKRYPNLVDKIRKGDVKNYRHVLDCATTEPVPIKIVQPQPNDENNHDDIHDWMTDSDYDYDSDNSVVLAL